MKSLLLIISLFGLSACAHQMLVVSPTTSTASVIFSNSSTGFTQQYFFEDPITCKGPSIITPLEPRESKSLIIPAGRTITIWTSAWGLPAEPGKVAWCRPSALSTRLLPSHSYRIEFIADPYQKKCGVLLSSPDDPYVKQVLRHVDGPEIAGGPLTKSFSCGTADDLGGLTP